MQFSDYKLSYFSHILQNGLKGHFRGMSFGTVSADATIEKSYCGFDAMRKIEDEKRLNQAEFENKQRLKIAEFIFSKIQKGIQFRAKNKNDIERTVEVYKIEDDILKYRPTKESKRMTEMRFAKEYPHLKVRYIDKGCIGIDTFLNACLTNSIFIKFIVLRDEETKEVLSIQESSEFNLLV